MKNQFAFIIAAVLAVALIVFLMLMPAWDEITALQVEIDLKTNDLNAAKDTLEKMINLQEIYRNNEENIVKIESLVPSGADLPAVLNQVENLIAASNLFLGSISFSEVEKREISSYSPVIGSVSSPEESFFTDQAGSSGAGVEAQSQSGGRQKKAERNCKAMEIGLELKGDYDSIKKFIGEMEKNIRLTDIVSLSLSEEKESEASGRFNLELKANTYYQ